MKVVDQKQLKLYGRCLLRDNLIELIQENFTEHDEIYLDYTDDVGYILISMYSDYEREETRRETYLREKIEESRRKEELKEYRRLKKKFEF